MAIIFPLIIFLAVIFALRRLLQFLSKSEPPHVSDSVSLEDDSSSPSLFNYDVFLSFRGADVRRSFVSHLYEALSNEGIETFHDDRELRKGNFIWEGLKKALNQSRFAIVVISEGFVTSHWCLREISVMVDLAEKNRIELIPVFYGIDPSDLKKRNGCFNKAFEKHEARYGLEIVDRWRKALGQVGNISGWESKCRNEDSELVHEIVQDINGRLSSDSSGESTDLVGMSYHKKRMESCLSMESGEVRMVGIWGMGGRGKTTVAKYVFESLSNRFDACCLLENLKGDFKQYGPSHMRKVIMSEFFPRSRLNVQGITSDAMKRRVYGKKVLLVLDDVDDLQQLQELANIEWFGPGSRIIITTRDKRVLEEHCVEHIYEVEPLTRFQALQLFCKHAFRMNHPLPEYRELSLDIVKQLSGLPLALRVIGASLYLRDNKFWKDKLFILKNTLEKSISVVLKVSYYALDKDEKSVFLYVAGCFKGEYMDRVEKALDPFVFSSGPWLVTLMEKSLISKSNNTRLWVHDLLQDMAKDIIREGKEERPWKRRMLWNFLDIKGLFTNNMGTEDIVVESILLNMADETELCINLPDSSFETLWSGTQDLRSLKHMNLNRCRNLIEIPDLSKANGLESLCLCECESLVELPSSLGCLDNLVKLSLQSCTKLKNLPPNIYLNSLKILSLDECSSMEEFPFVSDNIEELGLSWTSIEIVPASIERLSRLRELRLSQCKRLKNLPDTIGNLESLKHLWLAYCPNITEFPVLGNRIETLSLSGTAVEEVPSSIGDKLNLDFLDMSECQRLKNLPHTLRNLKNLKLLYLRGCTNITELPQIAGEMRKLDLYGTSIEKYGILSEDEVLELHKRDMEFLKGFLTRYVRNYKKTRNSR